MLYTDTKEIDPFLCHTQTQPCAVPPAGPTPRPVPNPLFKPPNKPP